MELLELIMKDSVILLVVGSTVCTALFITLRERQIAVPHSVPYGKPVVERIDFGGGHKRSRVKSVPARMSFTLVALPAKSGLTPLETQIWQLPHTNRRPAFCVVGTYYRDSTFPSARVLVLEWKHVPGVTALSASGVSEIPFNPFNLQKAGYPACALGSISGTDVAFFSAGLSFERAKYVALWVSRPSPSAPVDTEILKMRGLADSNARAIATAVEARAISALSYDGNLASYAIDLGGTVPVNPCTGTVTGYLIRVQGHTATVTASAGNKCGDWMPQVFSLTL